jgi:trigger factor
LQIGKAAIAREIDEQLIGMKAGEQKPVTVQFPQDHFNKALADQKVDFQVRLREIREEILPKIDDELAKDVGDYQNLEALKAQIFDNLKKGYEKRTDQELNEQIFKALIEKIPFEVPETLVEAELEGILSDVERSFQYRNKKLEDVGLTRNIMAERYRETAEKQVRRFLILDKIIEQESLKLGDGELETEMTRMAETLNQPIDEINRYYKENGNRLKVLEHGLLEKKAMALIIDNSQIEEVRQKEDADPEIQTEKKEKE